MTSEQREFKIKKRTSYEEQVKDKNGTIIFGTFLTGLTAIGVVSGLHATGSTSLEAVQQIFGFASGTIATIGCSCSLIGTIMAVSKKTMLEGKIEDINTELEMSENEAKIEESKGKNR